MSNVSKKPQQDEGEFPLKYMYISVGIVLVFMLFFFIVTHTPHFNA